MSADSTPIPSAASLVPVPGSEPVVPPEAGPATRRRHDGAIPSRRERSVPHAGWMVVAGKEFADHLWSARFVVLLIVLGLAAFRSRALR